MLHFSLKVDPIYLKSQNQANTISCGSSSFPIKIGGTSVMGFLGYDDWTYKQTEITYLYIDCTQLLSVRYIYVILSLIIPLNKGVRGGEGEHLGPPYVCPL